MQLGVKSLVLQNFKAFQRLNLPLEGQVSVLVGPNNAGKSTAISALRSAAAMTRIAFRKNPSTRPKDLGYSVWGYPFTSAQQQLDDENLRWDFRQQEVRLELEFTSGLSLRAIWP